MLASNEGKDPDKSKGREQRRQATKSITSYV